MPKNVPAVARRPLRCTSFTRGIPLLAMLLLAAGCGDRTQQPRFRINVQDILQIMPSHDPAELEITGDEDADALAEKKRKIKGLGVIATVLHASFGTPDEPYLFTEIRAGEDNETGLDFTLIERASGPVRVGPGRHRQRGLYRQHCAHCHGITGDGAGPTAAFLDPYPRDYRQGMFKFKSTSMAAKPTTADLKRILVEGIPGTAMPSFSLLPDDEIDALVEYVKYLSIRGQAEINLAITVFSDDDEIDATRSTIVDDYIMPVVDDWAAAEEAVIQPPERPATDSPAALAASIEAGRKLFLSKDAQCVQCHGPTGLGDGWTSEKKDPYDDWNKNKNPDEIARWLLPRQTLQPRNLRLGIYRGGRRPVDLYRRIHAGIQGAQMPGAGPGPGKPEGTLTPEQIWHVVDYVRSLPYEDPDHPQRPARVTLHKPRN